MTNEMVQGMLDASLAELHAEFLARQAALQKLSGLHQTPLHDYKDQLIATLLRENEAHQVMRVRHLDIIDRLTKAEEAKGDPLVDQVENVIKGVMSGKVPARKVEELHNVTGRAKQDGAVIRNINRS